MLPEDYSKLRVETIEAIMGGCRSVAVIGANRLAAQLICDLRNIGMSEVLQSVYAASGLERIGTIGGLPIKHPREAMGVRYDLLVVTEDAGKEDLLRGILPYLSGTPRVIVGGYGHFAFRDATFESLLRNLLVPSLANGYPNTLVHLYQCLQNASRLKLNGIVVEFGMFKGGTTMFLSRAIEHFGERWKVVGFDTFQGFPPRRSALDMYAHPDCVFSDLARVEAYLAGRNVEIITGDVVETSPRLADEEIVLTFVDTDNYTSASAALQIVRERTVVGGAIVFDHFTGTNRFLYTLGERMAAAEALEADPRYFNLHGTGVFYRQS